MKQQFGIEVPEIEGYEVVDVRPAKEGELIAFYDGNIPAWSIWTVDSDEEPGSMSYILKKKRWKPKEGEACFELSEVAGGFAVDKITWEGLPFQEAKFEGGMIFRLNEQAVAAADALPEFLKGFHND